jgi:uncharacterized protein YuzE
MGNLKTNKSSGKELYGMLNVKKADALVELLNETDLEVEGIIGIDKEEKMILFEIMRASTELNMPGQTLLFSVFDRNFVMGKIKWGNSVFTLKMEPRG